MGEQQLPPLLLYPFCPSHAQHPFLEAPEEEEEEEDGEYELPCEAYSATSPCPPFWH